MNIFELQETIRRHDEIISDICAIAIEQAEEHKDYDKLVAKVHTIDYEKCQIMFMVSHIAKKDVPKDDRMIHEHVSVSFQQLNIW